MSEYNFMQPNINPTQTTCLQSTIEACQRENERLRAQLGTYSELIRTVTAERDFEHSLRTAHLVHESNVAQDGLDGEPMCMTDRCSRLRNEFEILRERNRELERESGDLKGNEDIIKELRRELNETKIQLMDRERMLNGSSNELEEMRGKLERMQKASERLSDETEDVRRERDELRNQLEIVTENLLGGSDGHGSAGDDWDDADDDRNNMEIVETIEESGDYESSMESANGSGSGSNQYGIEGESGNGSEAESSGGEEGGSSSIDVNYEGSESHRLMGVSPVSVHSTENPESSSSMSSQNENHVSSSPELEPEPETKPQPSPLADLPTTTDTSTQKLLLRIKSLETQLSSANSHIKALFTMTPIDFEAARASHDGTDVSDECAKLKQHPIPFTNVPLDDSQPGERNLDMATMELSYQLEAADQATETALTRAREAEKSDRAAMILSKSVMEVSKEEIAREAVKYKATIADRDAHIKKMEEEQEEEHSRMIETAIVEKAILTDKNNSLESRILENEKEKEVLTTSITALENRGLENETEREILERKLKEKEQENIEAWESITDAVVMHENEVGQLEDMLQENERKMQDLLEISRVTTRKASDFEIEERRSEKLKEKLRKRIKELEDLFVSSGLSTRVNSTSDPEIQHAMQEFDHMEKGKDSEPESELEDKDTEGYDLQKKVAHHGDSIEDSFTATSTYENAASQTEFGSTETSVLGTSVSETSEEQGIGIKPPVKIRFRPRRQSVYDPKQEEFVEEEEYEDESTGEEQNVDKDEDENHISPTSHPTLTTNSKPDPPPAKITFKKRRSSVYNPKDDEQHDVEEEDLLPNPSSKQSNKPKKTRKQPELDKLILEGMSEQREGKRRTRNPNPVYKGEVVMMAVGAGTKKRRRGVSEDEDGVRRKRARN